MTEVVGSARSQWDGLLHPSLAVNGSRDGVGVAQGSLSNYRLKLPARGRPSADARLRTRAAA